MNQNVLKRIENIEYLWGIKYTRPTGALYKTLKVIYVILGIYTLAINLFYILGVIMMSSSDETFKYKIPYIIFVGVASLLLIASFIVMKKNDKLWAIISTTIASISAGIALIVIFSNQLGDITSGFLGYKISFYWRHLIPLVLMALLVILMAVIAIRAILKRRALCKLVCEMVKDVYGVSLEERDLSLEEWNKFIKNNNPKNYKKQFNTNE